MNDTDRTTKKKLDNIKTTDLPTLFGMLNAALGERMGWTLRCRRNNEHGSIWWIVTTSYGMDADGAGITGEGSTPEDALRYTIDAMLARMQVDSREHEDKARQARDELNRLQRAIESP